MKKEKFGLFTAVSMIAGIVIGSGIFFKTDDILFATSGSVLSGVLLWVVGAVGIIFGGLCVSEYAKRNNEAGGLITYCEMAWGKAWGYLAGWFQVTFYFPAISAILAFVSSIYVGLLFGIQNPLDYRIWLITILSLVGIFVLNIFQTIWASRFQNLSLIVKLTALILLSVVGIFFGDPVNFTMQPITDKSPQLFAGLVACAFAYDGWFVAPSIAHELKNPKRDLPLALIFSPVLILCIYLTYFIGINFILGPETIMALGDGSVGYIVNHFLGDFGTKAVYITVIISVLGSVNGLVLGYIRMPYALAIRDDLPMSHHFKTLDNKYNISINSAILCFILIMLWLGLHALSQFKISFGFINFSGFEIDSIPIVLTYFFYLSLYFRLIDILFKTKKYLKILLPVMATLGAFLVIYGGMSQDNALVYFLLSFMGIGLGLIIRPKQKEI